MSDVRNQEQFSGEGMCMSNTLVIKKKIQSKKKRKKKKSTKTQKAPRYNTKFSEVVGFKVNIPNTKLDCIFINQQ